MSLIYRVISSLSYVSSGIRRIVCAQNSQMISSLSLLCVLQCMQYLDNFKLSTRDREEYTGHENIQDFTVAANPRLIEEVIDGSAALASHRSARFFGLFFVSSQVSLRSRYQTKRNTISYTSCIATACNDFDRH